MNRKTYLLVVATAILLLSLTLSLTNILKSYDIASRKFIFESKKNCPIIQKQKTVLGNSLDGLADINETVLALEGYYKCNEVERGDIVMFSYGKSQYPVIKVVRGMPGDAFSLSPASNGQYLLLNNEIAKTSKGEPYVLDKRSADLLSLYIRDYNGVIPKNAFLILGNRPYRNIDSTRIGLISKSAFLGKIIKN